MPYDIQQYQQKASLPFLDQNVIAQFVAWHQPLSEPIRFEVTPQLRIALAASGLFAPVLNPETQITQNFESRWHYPWSEPKRFRQGIHPSQTPFFSTFFDINPRPDNQIQGWFQDFRGPVWPKKGLAAYLQQTEALHPRHLPSADVVSVWIGSTPFIYETEDAVDSYVTEDGIELYAIYETSGAIETNNDVAAFDVYVHDEIDPATDQTAVFVSITELIEDVFYSAEDGETLYVTEDEADFYVDESG